jgi:TolB-like protein
MSDSESRLRVFLSELRRRRVFRVAVVYAIVSFALLQLGEIVFPALKLPDWSLTLLVALIILAFPVAMVLAWAFDVTPEGVVRTEALPEETSPFRAKSRVPALIAVGVVSVATAGTGLYVLPKLPTWFGAESAPAAVSRDSRTKLVVLPFVNLGSPVDKYFADGITEEITAQLASIQGLGVIARTTAIQYKNTDKTVSEIGDDLGVDYVLEGTIRWETLPDGTSRVRVTPQLIRVEDATHVWAHIYEEPMESVFQVQSAIAERVVDELGVTLVESERLALRTESTQNVDAYQFYLLGNQYLQSASATGSQQALEMFEKALELDPNFEFAQKKLAEAYANLYWGRFKLLVGVVEVDYVDAAEDLYVESFGADSAGYYLVKGILLGRAGQPAAAEALYDTARAVLEPMIANIPGDARLHAQLGLAYAGLGRKDAAI